MQKKLELNATEYKELLSEKVYYQTEFERSKKIQKKATSKCDDLESRLDTERVLVRNL